MTPGTHIKAIGIWSVRKGQEKSDKSGPTVQHVKHSYLHVVGIQTVEEETGRVSSIFSPEEEEVFHDRMLFILFN